MWVLDYSLTEASYLPTAKEAGLNHSVHGASLMSLPAWSNVLSGGGFSVCGPMLLHRGLPPKEVCLQGVCLQEGDLLPGAEGVPPPVGRSSTFKRSAYTPPPPPVITFSYGYQQSLRILLEYILLLLYTTGIYTNNGSSILFLVFIFFLLILM